MYIVSFFQDLSKQVEAIDFILQDSVYLFTDGKSTVAAFPASSVSGVIWDAIRDYKDDMSEDPDWDDEEDNYVSPLTEEEKLRLELMNNAVANVYSKGLADTLKQQMPLDKIFDRKPLPASSGNDIQFFNPRTTTGVHTDTQSRQNLAGRQEGTNVCSDLGSASAITNSPASGEQLPTDASHYIPFVDWKAGFAPILPSERASFEASMKLKQDDANESAANEAQIASDHYWNEKGDWSSPYYRAQKKQPTLAELLNIVDEAQARVDARFAEITARMKQESESKAVLDELVNEKY